MEHLQQPQAIPHIVQVYQPSITNSKQNPQILHISHPSLSTSQGKVTYQQTLTSQSIQIPVTTHVTQSPNIQMTQNHSEISPEIQIVINQHNIGLQTSQTQVLSSTDINQQLQIASHVILPQHVVVNGVQSYCGHYSYPKEQCMLSKLEPDTELVEKEQEEPENTCQNETESSKKRSRSLIPDPKNWACNVRKLKHQRGEAYISRRGKYVPERQIKTTKDCIQNCKYKCNEKITNEEREQIFKAFYSLTANEKRYFLLNTTERVSIKHSKVANVKRNYTFRYYFTVKFERHSVCKNFYLGTLAISQKPVYNVHKGKTDLNIPKPDGRGHSGASTHSLPLEEKDRVRKHIESFKTIGSKPIEKLSKKKQYLESNLSVKQMYNMYLKECDKANVIPVKESMYRKIFKQEYNLHFMKIKTGQQLCGRCIKKK